MKKLIFLLFLLIPSLLFAQDWQEARMNLGVVGGGVAAGAPPGDDSITSGFADLTGFTEDVGDWTADGDLTCSTGVDAKLRYSSTALANSYRQYGKLKVTFYPALDIVGFLFRSTGTTGYQYGVLMSGETVYWNLWNGNTWDSEIGNGTGISPALEGGGWVGAEVEGTGTSTKIRAWGWASDPGARADWGTCDRGFYITGQTATTCTGNTAVTAPSNYGNTGTYAGLTGYYSSSSVSVDDWTVGSSSGAL